MKTNRYEITIVTYCPFCNEAHEIQCNEEDYLDWQDGMTAQEAFPYLSANDREMLISGICPSCWSALFEGME